MSPYKKLLNNSALFAIGNMGSNIISFILVPVYTYYLTTAEYGTIDLVTTTSSMLIPIISLSIFEAILRFILDQDNDTETVITNGLFVTFIGGAIVLATYPILKYFHVMDGVLEYLLFILMLQVFQRAMTQFARAIEKIKEYAINGMLLTLSTGLLNLVLVVYYRMGINGYLLSLIISYTISILYLIYATKVSVCINFTKINLEYIGGMLKYSIPLIPNSFMWWLLNASNRYFILLYIGAGANGLFAVANKIPNLLTMLSSIFFQAWQLTAIEEFKSENKSKMYSDVFNYFGAIMFIGTSGILVFIKIVMRIIFEESFYESWTAVPFLLLGVTFSSFSSFLGTNYIAAKETKGVIKTSLIGAVVSLILNVLLINKLGIVGAAISTMVGFFVVWLIRIFDTKKYIEMKINLKSIIWSISIILGQVLILNLKLSIILEMLFTSLLFFVMLLVNKFYIKEALKKILRKTKNINMK